jgi:hypothetical protein
MKKLFKNYSVHLVIATILIAFAQINFIHSDGEISIWDEVKNRVVVYKNDRFVKYETEHYEAVFGTTFRTKWRKKENHPEYSGEDFVYLEK